MTFSVNTPLNLFGSMDVLDGVRERTFNKSKGRGGEGGAEQGEEEDSKL